MLMEIPILPSHLTKHIFLRDLNESKYSALPNVIWDERSKNSIKGNHLSMFYRKNTKPCDSNVCYTAFWHSGLFSHNNLHKQEHITRWQKAGWVGGGDKTFKSKYISVVFCVSFFYLCAFENLSLNQDMPYARTDKTPPVLWRSGYQYIL